MRVYLVYVFLLMDCMSEGSTSASYGSLKHLLTSHVPCVWSFHSESLCKRVNPSHPDHFIRGQKVCSCDSHLFDTTSVGWSSIHHRVHIVQLSCRRWHWKGDQWPLQRSVHFHIQQLLWPWCFSSSYDCFVRMVIVICQLWWSHHANRKSCMVVLHHCLPSHHAHTSLLSPILSFFSLFPVKGSRIGQHLCDDQNHFSVSFILLSASILISPKIELEHTHHFKPTRGTELFLLTTLMTWLQCVTQKNVEKWFSPKVFLLLFRLWIALFAPFWHLCLF